MTIILLVLLVIAIGALIQQYRYRRRIVKTSTRLIGDLNYKLDIRAEQCRELEQNYNSLEEGQQEIIDNYENDLLDLREKKEVAENAAAYDREMREEVEKKLEQANLVIEKHSDKCDILVEDIADLLIAEVMPPSE